MFVKAFSTRVQHVITKLSCVCVHCYVGVIFVSFYSLERKKCAASTCFYQKLRSCSMIDHEAVLYSDNMSKLNLRLKDAFFKPNCFAMVRDTHSRISVHTDNPAGGRQAMAAGDLHKPVKNAFEA